MNNIDKDLSDVLNSNYLPVEHKQEDRPVTLHQSDSVQPDVDYSRSNYYNLIEKGNEALEGILEVAKESQHPRAYEVAANMIKNLSDVTEKLMILQKQQQDLKPKEAAAPTNIAIDKAVFVGSTAELLKKLKNESAE